MSRALAACITVTDVLFMLYWAVVSVAAIGLIELPPNIMYGDYANPRVVAWNWTFFPLDVAFSIFGFMALSAARRGDPIWRPYAIVSLVLTMTAGGMAVAYWLFLLEFNPSWFLPNLLLLVWPLFFLGKLMRDAAPTPESQN